MRNTKRYHFGEVIRTAEHDILWLIVQPATATQLARRLGVSLDRCSSMLHRLESKELVRCLNPTANRNRLYWLTRLGTAQRRKLAGDKSPSVDFPDIDWELYASVCYSHRGEVIRSLSHAMQPSQIRRRATFQHPHRRMSANNVRDVIRYLKAHGIVYPVKLPKKRHPGYELTEMGRHMRRLLFNAEVKL